MKKTKKGEEKPKKTRAPVFCVCCMAKNRTLRRWHNSYLCEDCFRIMQRIGDEAFIKAMKGEIS